VNGVPLHLRPVALSAAVLSLLAPAGAATFSRHSSSAATVERHGHRHRHHRHDGEDDNDEDGRQVCFALCDDIIIIPPLTPTTTTTGKER
jgi:hypothetical protein